MTPTAIIARLGGAAALARALRLPPIHVEEGRLGDVSYVVFSDAKDSKGRPKAPRVELGHKASNGRHVPPSPSFYPVVRSSQKRVKRRITAAMRRAIKKEAGL